MNISIFTCLYVNVYICMFVYMYVYILCTKISKYAYGVATISMLLKMIGLFCNRTLLKRLYSAAL